MLQYSIPDFSKSLHYAKFYSFYAAPSIVILYNNKKFVLWTYSYNLNYLLNSKLYNTYIFVPTYMQLHICSYAVMHK